MNWPLLQVFVEEACRLATEPWKILIVDDERENLDYLYSILRNSTTVSDDPANPEAFTYKIAVAKSGKAALAKVAAQKPDLILLDVLMPEMTGFEVLAKLQASTLTKDIPVIFITGLDNAQDEERGLQLGAVDYIFKPFRAAVIKARINTHLRIVEHMRLIERMSMIDPLTGIANRRAFEERLLAEWAHAAREAMPLSLLILDLDHFKAYNDTYGHVQGDMALKTVAGAIVSTLKRATDFAARWGGEEFGVILPLTSSCSAVMLAEELRANVERSRIHSQNGVLTISVGVASASPLDTPSHEELVARADHALYNAKDSGRNRVCRWDS
jgi:diguanylate cyclase (GGDEF)-like protein